MVGRRAPVITSKPVKMDPDITSNGRLLGQLPTPGNKWVIHRTGIRGKLLNLNDILITRSSYDEVRTAGELPAGFPVSLDAVDGKDVCHHKPSIRIS